ncbi:AmmeMemoRadiSam system protein B [Acidianus sulfidivorans JP7]|uniref:MEMO1 family protein DFR86_05755 n=1 Tax=Acidianus sulfidivorans JP7 TaxID=619593 RepID=A0A2U9IM66_9CREN|nr:AmmeMemoRadiSam system protein B [Acidianus sulfidivorans]AWR97111.1 AmmeMemoRadiSam system protein B [Acidianus sulfidivorans JP7]
MTRLPAVAGSFYESDAESLKERIKWSFLHPVGPGKLPSVPSEKPQKRDNLFFIVPHAGYIYSGPVASHSYYYLASEGKPDIVIIIGPNHTGYGSYVSVWPKGYWETPLGKVEVDENLVKELVEYSEVVDLDEKAHVYEHSVEVQIPFLQYFFGSDFKIIPIVVLMQTPEIAEFLAQGILRLMEKHQDKDIVVLSSSDMNHYDPYDITYRKDELAIKEIIDLDYKGLYEVVEDKDVTMCGYAPVMVSMILAKKFQKKTYILKHATSGDTSGDKSSVVGYLAARFGS